MLKKLTNAWYRATGMSNLDNISEEMKTESPSEIIVYNEADKAAAKAMVYGWVTGFITGGIVVGCVLWNGLTGKETDWDHQDED
ncbi:MAG: hypothetical protein BWY50_01872 [Spirochaetes bacterium ADurb.Bin315]|nr:MAG: hypothetical protein BWY50_01872 [Spirochaetes bacterium ADurb.Bin315]